MKAYDDSLGVSRPFGRMWRHKDGWIDGEVVTPHGIVSVYIQGDKSHFHLTRLDFAYNGRLHMRSYEKRYRPQYCTTLASRFAKEVAARSRG